MKGNLNDTCNNILFPTLSQQFVFGPFLIHNNSSFINKWFSQFGVGKPFSFENFMGS